MLQKCLASVPKNYAVMNEWAELVLARLFTYGYMLMIARKNIKRKEQDLLAAGVVVNWCGAECNHPPWRTGTGTTTLYGRCVAVRQEFYFR